LGSVVTEGGKALVGIIKKPVKVTGRRGMGFLCLKGERIKI